MLFLDFDGVLFDTVKEAYAVATIATNKYSTISEVDFNTTHYKNFRDLRYLVSPAWNYKYILEELEKDKVSKADLVKKLRDAKKSDYKEFEKLFFKTRKYLKYYNYEEWIKLNQPFDFLFDIKNILENYSNRVYIITTKDRDTIVELFRIYNIKFDKDRIFDKDDYESLGSKKNIIQNLIIGKNNIFIDDSYKHINDCKSIEYLTTIQASWGYVDRSKVKYIDKEDIIDKIYKGFCNV